MPRLLRLQQQQQKQQQKNYSTSAFGGNISFLSAFRRASFILYVNKKFKNKYISSFGKYNPFIINYEGVYTLNWPYS